MSQTAGLPSYKDCKPMSFALGGGSWLNRGYCFTGAVYTKALIDDQFVPAFREAAGKAGLPADVIDAEVSVLTDPALWETSAPGAMVKMRPVTFALSFNVRYGLSTLPLDSLRRALYAGIALRTMKLSPDGISEAEASKMFNGMPRPIPEEYKDVISFVANLPKTADAALFSTTDKQVLLVSKTLRLDMDALKAGIRRVIPKPTWQQAACHSVCFWCGASPFSSGVQLRLCKGCECVAYCSDDCMALDYVASHALECGRREPAMDVHGAVVCPCDNLSMTRAITDRQKPQSCKFFVELPASAGPGVSLQRMACLVEGAPGPLPLDMGWIVN